LQPVRPAYSGFAGDYSLRWSDKCERLATLLRSRTGYAIAIFPYAGAKASAKAAGDDAASTAACPGAREVIG